MTRRMMRLVIAAVLTAMPVGVAACGTRHVQLIRESAMESDSHTGTDDDSSTEGNGLGGGDTETSEDTAGCVLNSGRIRITEIDVGQTVVSNEFEADLMPIAISPLPNGGSRLAWMGNDQAVHVTTLNETDDIIDNSQSFPAHDFQDLYATETGGALLLTRDAEGGGILNCGDEDNLCVVPESPIPCFDMYLVKFSEDGEEWATRLTSSNEQLPPYSTGPTGDAVTMIWWYAHHGRIASDGSSFAAYFGSAISVSSGSCVDIHQGDRMRVVDDDGVIIDGGFLWGCSPSGYERVIWNTQAHAYVSVCKSEIATSGVAAFAPDKSVIWNVDPWYSNLGELVLAPNGGYWLALSDRKTGQPERTDGLAEVHLLQFNSNMVNIHESVPSATGENVRSPHLAAFGADELLLLYESSVTPGELSKAPRRTTQVEVRRASDGQRTGGPMTVDGFTGHRYQALRSFSDGSVAMAGRGNTDTTIKILRVIPCNP